MRVYDAKRIKFALVIRSHDITALQREIFKSKILRFYTSVSHSLKNHATGYFIAVLVIIAVYMAHYVSGSQNIIDNERQRNDYYKVKTKH